MVLDGDGCLDSPSSIHVLVLPCVVHSISREPEVGELQQEVTPLLIFNRIRVHCYLILLPFLLSLAYKRMWCSLTSSSTFN